MTSAYMFDQGTPPRPAAALLLMDAGRGGAVLLGRRNEQIAFMGGHHVFPGGRVDADDARVPVRGADPETARFLAAAVRECFEEAGILLVSGPAPDAAAQRGARAGLLAERIFFSEFLAGCGCWIDAADYVPAGRWLTPSFSAIRYDTQYFLCRRASFPGGGEGGPEDEITALDWLAPAEALSRWRAGALRLSTPVAYALRSLARLPLDRALARMRRPPGVDRAAADFIEPRPGVLVVPLRTDTLPPATHTNCVIIGWEELLVVDPGAAVPEEQERLLARIADLETLGGRVAGVALTHGHKDHAGAAALIRERFGVPVHAHPLAAGPGLAVDAPLLDEMVLALSGGPGWRLRALHTPGHDPGHLALLEESTATLITGDLFANPGTILISPDHGGDMTAYLESLGRVGALSGLGMVVPGHGWPMPGHEGLERIHRLREYRLAREDRIARALAAGAATLEELVAAAYDDTPAELHGLALLQLRAHLRRLAPDFPGA